jgi:RNA polymerase sigma-70 factor, ECF subfamily
MDMNMAEDIVQDCYVKLWRTAVEIDPNRSVKSLIYTMVRNHALEVLRREQIGKKIAAQLPTGDIDESSYVEEAEIEKWRMIDLIFVSMRQLPPKCAEVFELSKINGLTYTQIAERLQISVKTVEAQMSKALKILREKLADHYQNL